MKPIVIYLPDPDEDGSIHITREAIDALIDQAYMQGVSDGSAMRPMPTIPNQIPNWLHQPTVLCRGNE